MTFFDDIKSKHLGTYVLVVISNKTEYALPLESEVLHRISTQKISLPDVVSFTTRYYKPILLNIPSISESLDIENRKYKISSVRLSISDYEEDGVRFSDSLNTLINKEVNIYYGSQSSESLYECYPAGNFIIRSFTQDEDKVGLNCEDLSQDKLHKDLVTENIADSENILGKYKGKPVPMAFGEVDKSPCVAFMGSDPSNSSLQIISDLSDSITRYNLNSISDLGLLDDTSNPLYVFDDDFYLNVLSYFTWMSHYNSSWGQSQYEVINDSPVININVNISSMFNQGTSPLSIDSAVVRTNDYPIKKHLKTDEEIALAGFAIVDGEIEGYLLQILFNATELGELINILFEYLPADNEVSTDPYYRVHMYTEQHQFVDLINQHGDFPSVYNQWQYSYNWLLQNFYGGNDKDYQLSLNNNELDRFNDISAGNSPLNSDSEDIYTDGWINDGDKLKYNEGRVTSAPLEAGASADNQLTLNYLIRNSIYLYKDFHKSSFFASVIGRGGASPTLQTIYSEILDELDFDTGAITNNTSIGKYAFTLDKKINSKKLLEEISASSPLFPYFKNGNFNVKSIKKIYTHGETIFIDANDVINYKYSQSKIEKVYMKVNVKYHYDYGLKDFTRETGYIFPTQCWLDEPPVPYSDEYFGEGFDQELVFESKYIRDEPTAFNLAKYLCGLHANQHNLITLTLPLNYLTLELGDIVRLGKLIQGRKIFGEDYSSISENDIGYVRNGQTIYKFWFITQIKKDLDKVEVKLYQLHKFDFVPDEVEIIEPPEEEEPEEPIIPDVGYCYLSDYEEYFVDEFGNPVDINNNEVNYVVNNDLCVTPIEEEEEEEEEEEPEEPEEPIGYCLIGVSQQNQTTPSDCEAQGGEWSASPFPIGCMDENAINFNSFADVTNNALCAYTQELQPPVIVSPQEGLAITELGGASSEGLGDEIISSQNDRTFDENTVSNFTDGEETGIWQSYVSGGTSSYLRLVLDDAILSRGDRFQIFNPDGNMVLDGWVYNYFNLNQTHHYNTYFGVEEFTTTNELDGYTLKKIIPVNNSNAEATFNGQVALYGGDGTVKMTYITQPPANNSGFRFHRNNASWLDSLVANQLYKLTFDLRSESEVNFTFRIIGLGTVSSYFVINTTWTTYEFDFTLSASPATFSISASSTGNAFAGDTLEIDNFSIRPVTEVEEPILSINFNKSPNLVQSWWNLNNLTSAGSYLIYIYSIIENEYVNHYQSGLIFATDQDSYTDLIYLNETNIPQNVPLVFGIQTISTSQYNGSYLFTTPAGLIPPQLFTETVFSWGEIDEDNDNVYTVTSIVQMIDFILGVGELTDEQLLLVDITEPYGLVNITDILAIIAIILGEE